MPAAGEATSQISSPCASVVARAQIRQALGRAAVLVGVEAADQPPAMRIRLALEHVGLHAHAGDWLAREIDRDDGELEPVLARDPAIGLDAEHDARGPERDARCGGQRLAIGIAILQLGDEVARPRLVDAPCRFP